MWIDTLFEYRQDIWLSQFFSEYIVNRVKDDYVRRQAYQISEDKLPGWGVFEAAVDASEA